jgi:hypothetical protein
MIVQGVSRAPNSFECFAEPTPIFCKDSANRAQYKMKGPRLSFLLPRCSLSYSKIVQGEQSAKRKTRFLICTSEPQPILSKDSANRAQYKMKGPRLSFLLPRCSLSYSKIVQGEQSAKRKTRFLICTSEPQPILSKDSANRAQYKMKGPRLSFLLPRCSLSRG